jgi:murein L,D-transpeptidase YcbB/YkuD
MLSKKNLYLSPSLFILLFIVGCAATSKYTDYEIQALETKVLLLEAELSDKNSQIAALGKALDKEKKEKAAIFKILETRKKSPRRITSSVKKQKKDTKTYYSSVIKIQTALKNAGFQPGPIDGKMGQRTQNALRRFQKANGLTADGWLDKKTWELLRNYL